MKEQKNYTYETLFNMIGETVSVSDAYQNEALLKIKEVIKHTFNSQEWDGFSIIYKGDKNLRIPQGTYLVKHITLGERDIFLSPKSDTEYENIITRINENFSDKKTAQNF